MPIIIPLTLPSPPGPTTNLSEWYRDVVPECPGLTLDYALHKIRNRAIDFCTRTWALKYTHTGTMVAADPTYDLTVPAGTEVTGLLWVKAQPDLTSEEREVTRANARMVAMMSQDPDAPQRYFIQPFDTITFFPAPDEAYTYSVQLALRPTFDATTIDSTVFTKYRMGIAHGILADLFASANKPWSSPSLASYHLGEYMRAIRDAKIELTREYTGESLMVELPGDSY